MILRICWCTLSCCIHTQHHSLRFSVHNKLCISGIAFIFRSSLLKRGLKKIVVLCDGFCGPCHLLWIISFRSSSNRASNAFIVDCILVVTSCIAVATCFWLHSLFVCFHCHQPWWVAGWKAALLPLVAIQTPWDLNGQNLVAGLFDLP